MSAGSAGTLRANNNLDTLAPGKDDRKRADYLVYTIGKPAS